MDALKFHIYIWAQISEMIFTLQFSKKA